MKNPVSIATLSEKAFLSRKETAFYLGLHVNTLDRANIPHAKIGNRTIYSKEVLEKWLADNSIGGSHEK